MDVTVSASNTAGTRTFVAFLGAGCGQIAGLPVDAVVTVSCLERTILFDFTANGRSAFAESGGYLTESKSVSQESLYDDTVFQCQVFGCLLHCINLLFGKKTGPYIS